MIEILSSAPVLNIPDFSFAFGGRTGSEIPLDEKGHPYCFEFVALKGMVFEVKESLPQKFSDIYRISCSFYPNDPLYVDSRFTKPAASFGSERSLPPPGVILHRMIEMTGTPYVWGGNWRKGIPEMLLYYPAKKFIDDRTSTLWTLNGVDCSGMLFEATNGATPRNTSQLIQYGEEVSLDASLKPLDMILYPGHVIFVQDEKTTIESKFPFGVIQRDLTTRIMELESTRKRVKTWTCGLDPHHYYTIRRFVET